MSIKLNDGTVLRNLEEQVQYLTNYHDVNQGLAQWGIKVIGQVETAEELPDPATYKGEYGDTYAVGTEAPFYFYIWTRAAIEGENPYWFPFGEISIVGPQGPKGDKGDKGDIGESSTWYAGTEPPTDAMSSGDMFLNTTNGNVYRFRKKWNLVTNIIGPQGPQGPRGAPGPKGEQGIQGPKGDTGDVGGFINIWGILSNINQAPTPASLKNLTAAYLVGASAPYDLWVQVGETSDTAVWTNTGPFNAATLVTVNGVAQNVWDADTKVGFTDIASQDKAGVLKVSGLDYGVELYNGTLRVRPPSDWNIVNARSNGNNSPVTLSKADLTLKECLKNPLVEYSDDDKTAACATIGAVKSAATPEALSVYAIDAEGNNIVVGTSTNASRMNTIPVYNSQGEIFIASSNSRSSAVNRGFLEDRYVRKLGAGTGWRVYGVYADGTEFGFPVVNAETPSTIPWRGVNGTVIVGTPTADNHAANKGYVDDNTHVLTRIRAKTSTSAPGCAYINCKRSNVVPTIAGIAAFLQKIGATTQASGIPIAMGTSFQSLWAEPNANVVHIADKDLGATPTWEIIE